MFVSNFRSKTLVQTALWSARELLDYGTLHPGREMRRQALDDSVMYLRSLPTVPPAFASSRQLLKFAAQEAAPKGTIVELGVFRGGTIRFLARQAGPDRSVHGFDTFRGLQSKWSGNTTTFDAGGEPPKVPRNVTLHVGLFADTLPGWVEDHPDPIALLHVDCDLYESTVTGLQCLAPRIREGTIIVFDEYFNYPGWQAHEFKAFKEFVQEHEVEYSYLGYASVQVAVRIDQIRPSRA